MKQSEKIKDLERRIAFLEKLVLNNPYTVPLWPTIVTGDYPRPPLCDPKIFCSFGKTDEIDKNAIFNA
jgi:hypothetical protein